MLGQLADLVGHGEARAHLVAFLDQIVHGVDSR
jgi:hypothetical protein